MTPTLPSLGTEVSEKCPQLEVPQEKSYDALLEAHMNLLNKYGKCAKAHNSLLDIWSKYDNSTNQTK